MSECIHHITAEVTIFSTSKYIYFCAHFVCDHLCGYEPQMYTEVDKAVYIRIRVHDATHHLKLYTGF